MMKKVASLLPILGLALILGCSSEPATFDVEGTVNFQGKPVPKGEIYFDPAPDVKGPQGRAIIQEGKFSTREQKAGIIPGKYAVRVHGFDGKPVQEAPYGKAIFPAYKIDMELQAGKPLAIEVPAK